MGNGKQDIEDAECHDDSGHQLGHSAAAQPQEGMIQNDPPQCFVNLIYFVATGHDWPDAILRDTTSVCVAQ